MVDVDAARADDLDAETTSTAAAIVLDTFVHMFLLKELVVAAQT